MANEEEEQPAGGERSGSCFQSPKFAIYLNYILSSWGDRMWHFAVGLYLVYFDGGVLLLAAIYGFTCGGTVLLLGGLIGQWVDRNPRLKVVRVSLFIQNFCVMGSALVVCTILKMEDEIEAIWGGKLGYVLKALVMLLAILARLASVSYKIAVEKDWIVIIAAGNSSQLANLNAVTRSMDLMCQVLAPTAVGQVMTFGSLLLSAIVIAAWNLVSVFIEYALLSRVYRLVPRLHYKENESPTHEKKKEGDEQEMEEMLNGKVVGETDNDNQLPEEKEKKFENGDLNTAQKSKNTSCVRLMFRPCFTLFNGWHVYARQKVVFAGCSLAFLYMTVLGFDSITVGYMYAQGVTEAILGAATAVAGLMGIVGTFLFTRARKRVGLERTGMMAFATQVSFLTLAVGSIWAPGSPFNLEKPYDSIACNQTSPKTPVPLISENGSVNLLHRHPRDVPPFLDYTLDKGDDFSILPLPYIGQESHYISSETLPSTLSIRSKRDLSNSTSTSANSTSMQETNFEGATCEDKSGVTVSVIIFLIGIVLSRIGLWMADMSVSQLLQEFVVENERGVVNGVQNSLNMLMDVLKFTMVIVAPHIHTFGVLIMLSFSFIILGGLCFVYHVYRTDCGRALQPITKEDEKEIPA